MKIKTAISRVWEPIRIASSTQPTTHDQYLLAEKLLKKYQRKFGNRHFNYHLRITIKNGLWVTGIEK